MRDLQVSLKCYIFYIPGSVYYLSEGSVLECLDGSDVSFCNCGPGCGGVEDDWLYKGFVYKDFSFEV